MSKVQTNSIVQNGRKNNVSIKSNSPLVALIKLLTALIALFTALLGIGAPAKYYISMGSENVEKIYSINYDLAYLETEQIKSLTVSSNQELIQPIPHREGYTFDGWFLKEDSQVQILNMSDLEDYSQTLSINRIISNIFTFKKLNIEVDLVAKWILL